MLETLERSRWNTENTDTGQTPPWAGTWEKLATVIWAVGTSIPLLVFAIGAHLFLADHTSAGNLVIGAALGSNIVSLSLAFGIALLSGPLTFFRLRSVTSPVFLLLATVIFIYMSLNLRLSIWEGFFLLLLILGYGFYFRKFSSEWKQFDRAIAKKTNLEGIEGVLPLVALICMGLGFFLLAIVVSYPFIHHLQEVMQDDTSRSFQAGAHVVALAISIPAIIRCSLALQAGPSAKAISLSSISHSCLLNVLFVPAMASFLGASDLNSSMLSFHIPTLFFFTGTFVATLLIEKERGGKLPWALLGLYFLYSFFGLYSW